MKEKLKNISNSSTPDNYNNQVEIPPIFSDIHSVDPEI